MDISALVSIVNALLAFTVGASIARDTDLPIWALSLVYFVVTTLVHIVGLYFYNK